jgi:hypothetical protein
VREPVFFRREEAPGDQPPLPAREAPVASEPDETGEAEPAQIAPERPRRSGWWNRGR